MTTAPPSNRELLRIRGTRVHNLQGLDLDLPRERLIVVTGVSGSGKSSLVFDTIAAAGQRQAWEGLPASLRRLLRGGERPDADQLSGIPPAIVVRSQLASRLPDPRLTVATWLGIESRLGQILSREGEVFCPSCGQQVTAPTVEAVAAQLLELQVETRLQVVERPAANDALADLSGWQAEGIVRGISQGRSQSLTELTTLPEWLVVDRLITGRVSEERLRESLEQATRLGQGSAAVLIETVDNTASEAVDGRQWRVQRISDVLRCEACQRDFPSPRPELFETRRVSVTDGGPPYAPDALAVRWRGRHIAEWLSLTPGGMVEGIGSSVEGQTRDAAVPSPRPSTLNPQPSTLSLRAAALAEVGLDWMPLNRPLASLSPAELRRVQMARVAVSEPRQSLLAFDEPSAGLHATEIPALVAWLRAWLQRRNTVLVVDHHPELVAAADVVVELGPRAGAAGGRLTALGEPLQVLADTETATARAWTRLRQRFMPTKERPLQSWAELLRVESQNAEHASPFLLSTLDSQPSTPLSFPLDGLTVITGVSGSGKTSLLKSAIVPAMQEAITNRRFTGSLEWIDQSPLTASQRTVVATWLKVFDEIRGVFAGTADAQRRAWPARMFSFHAADGGRCRACAGRGVQRLGLGLLADLRLTCQECGGSRYRPEVLEVRYRGLSIADVLNRTVAEAASLFRQQTTLHEPFRILERLGLDYLVLGQAAESLSGGEAQRLRLAQRLWQRTAGRTLILADEPAAGLHPLDVDRLVDTFRELVSLGHGIVVAENARELLEAADWIIELDRSGRIASGTPGEFVDRDSSLTGHVLRGQS